MSYGSWINGVIDNAKKKVNSAVKGAVQAGQNIAQDIVSQGQPIVDNAIDNAKNVPQNVSVGYGNWINGITEQADQTISGLQEKTGQAVDYAKDAARDAVGGLQEKAEQAVDYAKDAARDAVGNVSQGITDKVNGVNEQVQAAVGGNVQQSTTPVQSTTLAETPMQVPTEHVTTPSEPSSSTASEPVDSYEVWLQKQSEGYGTIKDKTIDFYDKQNAEALAAIDEKKKAADAHATDVKETTDAALKDQKNEAYKYADETLASTLGYNQEAFDVLVKSITEQMEAGKISAEEGKNLLLTMANEQKGLTYEAAERMRTEAEKEADIARQRAIVDAGSAYEQNKAEYGAKAEALGRMGLNDGGYADWLNAGAYAQQRAETQAARAKSEAAKREARYTEDQTKLAADSEFNNKKYSAESDYLDKLYNIDTTYRTNMANAEQEKLAADKGAYDTARDTKMQADSDERAGKLQNDISYKGYLYDNESTAKEETLAANQSAAAGKLQAEISYVEAIMDNEGKLAEYKKSLEDGSAEAEEKKLALYEQLMRGASNGTYTAEDAAALADAFGFSAEWKTAVVNSANGYQSGVSGAENKANAEITSQRYTSLLTGAANGTFNEATVRALAKEYGLSEEQTAELARAAQGYATEKGNAAKLDEATQAGKTFVGLLDSIASGAFEGYDAKQIAEIAGQLGLTLTDAQKGLVDQAMKNYSGNVGEADADYKNGVYMELLAGAKNGAYTEAEITDFVTRYGLDEGMASNLTTAVKDYNTNVSNAKNEAVAADRSQKYAALIVGAANGTYNEDTVKALAPEYGLDDKQTEALVKAVKGKAGEKTGDAYVDLMIGVSNGSISKEVATALAKHYGLDEGQTASVLGEADNYNTKVGTAEAKDEAAQKTANFVSLLASANSGELTKDELMQVAKELGFDTEKDKTQLDLLGKAADRFATGTEEDKAAAKNMSFISLLDGANTGAYNSEQIVQMAEMFGLDPENEDDANLIGMLKTAADDFATGEAGKTAKADEEYQNGIFAELLAAANNGDFTEEQIKELAKRFGIEDPDDILGQAAKSAVEKVSETEKELEEESSTYVKNEYINNGYITGVTTDEEIDSLVEDKIISQPDGEELKEYRNKQAKEEIAGYVNGGNITEAAEKTDEYFERGIITEDEYHGAYFDMSLAECSPGMSAEDLLTGEAELKNRLNEGKLTQKDYDALVRYMYASQGGVLDSESYSYDSNGINLREIITIGDTEFKYGKAAAVLYPEANDTTKTVLNKLCGGTPTEGTLVMLNGQLYLYRQRWREMPDVTHKGESLYSTFNLALAQQPKAKKPKHEKANSEE